MQYRKMGRTGLKVSSYCLGTMTFGRQVEEKESIQIMNVAIDAGVGQGYGRKSGTRRRPESS